MINILPIHVGAEGLVAVYIKPRVAKLSSRFITIEYLCHPWRQDESCGAVDHVVHVGVVVIGIVEIIEGMPVLMRCDAVGMACHV